MLHDSIFLSCTLQFHNSSAFSSNFSCSSFKFNSNAATDANFIMVCISLGLILIMVECIYFSIRDVGFGDGISIVVYV